MAYPVLGRSGAGLILRGLEPAIDAGGVTGAPGVPYLVLGRSGVGVVTGAPASTG